MIPVLCQSCQNRRFDANCANRGKLKINNLCVIKELRTTESLLLRQLISN